ncbi:epoxide hydrolase N-terminal domain-containing protein [Micromonospora sp. M12]
MAGWRRSRLPAGPGVLLARRVRLASPRSRAERVPQHVALVGGRKLHFLHARAARPAGTPAPLPLLLSHGWPSSFVEMLPLVDRLTDPPGRAARSTWWCPRCRASVSRTFRTSR